MHMYVFVFDQNTLMTEMTLFGAQVGKGGKNIKFLVPLKGGQKIFKAA